MGSSFLKEKTFIIIERETHCYTVMPFGLNIARATYQRLVNKLFHDQIKLTMEIDIDGILVKSQNRPDRPYDAAQ